MIAEVFKQKSWLKSEENAYKTLFDVAKAKYTSKKEGFQYCLTLNPLGYLALKKKPDLIHQADFLIADGIGFFILSKLFCKACDRIAGIEMAEALLEGGVSVALLGAKASVSARLKRDFNALFPNSTLVLCQDGFCFDSKDVIKKLKEYSDEGIIDSSVVAGEVEAIIGDIAANRFANTDQLFKYMLQNPIFRKATEFYQAADNLWKAYGYEFTKSQLVPAIPVRGLVAKEARASGYRVPNNISDNQKKDNKINIFEQLYDSDYFNLLLVHQPSIWNSLKEKANLTLSGHTHNGQIFPFNLIVKIQFPQIYGVYNHLKNYLYVSSGAATWGPKIRIGSKNEILNIELSNNP